jgi:hypothetical protein
MLPYTHQKFSKIFRRVKIPKAPTSIHTDLLIIANPATSGRGGGSRPPVSDYLLGRMYVTHTSDSELACNMNQASVVFRIARNVVILHTRQTADNRMATNKLRTGVQKAAEMFSITFT